MKRLIVLFTLLIFGPIALADSSSILHPDALNNYTDLSVNYLSQLFGTVGNVLTGGNSQMMGKLFYILNSGILIVAGILIGYSVLFSTIRIASEGVSISQGKSTLFSVLKVALGISLIIPNPSTGYSVLQDIVMKTVVYGVGLADSVWDNGLDYLNKGGVIGVNTAGKSQTNLAAPKNVESLFSSKVAGQIFANEVCMFGSRDDVMHTGSGNSSASQYTASTDMRPNYSVWQDTTNHTFNFPGLTDTSATSGNACGSVSWNIANACSGDSGNCATTRQAMTSLVNAMLPLAQKYYCSQTNTTTDSCKAVDTNYSDDYVNRVMFNSLFNYYANIQPYASLIANKNTANKSFIAGAKADGWINAGRYYWDVMQFYKDKAATENLSNYVVSDVPGPNKGDLNSSSIASIVNGAAAYLSGNALSTNAAGGGVNPNFQKYINDVYSQANPGYQANTTGTEGGHIISGAAAGVIGPAYLNPGVGATLTTAVVKLNQIGDDFKNPGVNPISFLYKIGKDCLNAVLTIWIVGGATIGATMIGFGVCQASNPMGVAGQTIASWFTPFVTMIATMLWAAGFFLCFYVPLYPFAIFLFAAMGWLISVIEAMVAAPLVALGLTHPENHDFLGKSEQAVMLLLGVFIQPSLLVIGLIAGIILSFIGFKLLMYGFSGFVVDMMGSASSHHGTNILAATFHSPLYSSSILLTQPLVLIMFCVLTYSVLTQSFSLIFVLRDNVMRWIGAPGSGLQSPEQMMSDTRGAISASGRATGEAQGSMISGMSRDGQQVSKGARALGQNINDIGKSQRKASQLFGSRDSNGGSASGEAKPPGGGGS